MKNTISYIFQGLGLLIMLFAILLGLSYVTKGSEIVSIGGAIVVTLFFFFLVNLMIRGKSRNQNKGFTRIEGIALFLYTLIATAAFIVVRHTVNVDYLLKSQIISDAKSKLDQTDNMFDEYEAKVSSTINLIDTDLRTAINLGGPRLRKAFEECGSNRVYNYNSERRNIKAANESRALNGLSSMKQEFTDFKNKKEGELDRWSRFKIHRVLSEIDDKYDKQLNSLQEKFMAPADNQAWNKYTFEYPLSSLQGDLLYKPSSLNEKYHPSWGIPFLGFLLTHFFILIPYLFKEREGGRFINSDEVIITIN